MISVLPVMEPGPERTLNVTGFPEAPPVAVSVMGTHPYVMVDDAVKLIVCVVAFTVNCTVLVAVE
jgi:hypothetical protein